MHQKKLVLLSLFSFLLSSVGLAQSIEKIDFKSHDQRLFSNHRLQVEWLKGQRKYAKLIRQLSEDHPEIPCKSLVSSGKYSLSSECFHEVGLKSEYSEGFLATWKSLDEKLLKLLGKNESGLHEAQVELWAEALREEISLLDSLIIPAMMHLYADGSTEEGAALKQLNKHEFNKKLEKKAFHKRWWVQKHVPRYDHIRPKKDRDLKRLGHMDPVRLSFSQAELRRMASEVLLAELTAEELEELEALRAELAEDDLIEEDEEVASVFSAASGDSAYSDASSE